jgi:HEAT repeat protein
MAIFHDSEVRISSGEFVLTLETLFRVTPEEVLQPGRDMAADRISGLAGFIALVANHSPDPAARALARKLYRPFQIASGKDPAMLDERGELARRLSEILGECIEDVLGDVPLYVVLEPWIVPILFKMLSETKYPENKESLVRCLAAAQDPIPGKPLMDLFDDQNNPELLRWAVGNTIYSTKNDVPNDWLLSRLADPNIDGAKGMLFELVGKRKIYGAREILEQLLDDHPGHAAAILRKLGDARSIPALRRALEKSEDKEERKIIAKAIEKLEQPPRARKKP